MKVEVKGYIIPNNYKRVYDWFGIDATCPKDISDAIEGTKDDQLDVEISTCYGGDVFSGSQMYSAIRDFTGKKNIKVTGLAASAASVIAMAGPSEMSPTAMLMVHRVSSSADGNYHAMDTVSESLQQADKAIAASYVAKSGMDEKDALKLMDKETWITAQQAVDLKLIDRVSGGGVQQMVAAYGMPLPQAVIDKTLAMLAKEDHPENAPQNLPKGDPENGPEDTVKINLAKAKLNLIERSIS